ncbi:TetR/AcrR family transcriptional regulator [Neogemmobacter tilapiae]|nr:TetR/AcrR family transcriptional regulator [Gemmobacter tilapiae]
MAKTSYHHGNLGAALLLAAGEELEAVGVEGFSLRKVAARAGVSHTAVQHHFGDMQGLLTALAAQAYRDMEAAMLGAGSTLPPADRLVEMALAYVAFAESRPALFRLLFGSKRPDYDNADLHAASTATYATVQRLVGAAGGQGAVDEAAIWGTAHGLAELSITGKLGHVVGMDAAVKTQALRHILRRVVPQSVDKT